MWKQKEQKQIEKYIIQRKELRYETDKIEIRISGASRMAGN